MTKRVLLFALIIVAMLAGAAAFAFGPVQKKLQAKTWSIESPNKTYRLIFTGSAAVPSWPFTDQGDVENRKVTVDIVGNGISIVQHYRLYEGDAYDSSFEGLYPDSEWLSEGTLHLWQKGASQNMRALPGEIFVSNQSDQAIKYLYLKAGKTNLFLLFDLKPGSKTHLPIHLEHWEQVIGCEGKLGDRELPYRSANFSLSAVDNSKTQYNVIVKNDGCAVTRTE